MAGLVARIALGAVAPALWLGYETLFKVKSRRFKRTTEKMQQSGSIPSSIKISIVIPAYNEEDNIVACVQAVLENTDLSFTQLEVVVVDDLSTDRTVARITQFKEIHPRGNMLTVMSAGSRPTTEVWLGKCWAVTQASKQCTGDYIIFIDADVRVKQGGIVRATSVAINEGADLLSGDLQYKCNCSSEQLVQPVVIQNMILNNDHELVNDPKQPVASAAGHMMIFKKEVYDAIGGHKVVRDHVVEDVMIAYFLKTVAHLKVHYYDFTSVAYIAMYPNFRDLLEGYSKNIFLAFDSSLVTLGIVCLLNLFVFVGPPVTFVCGLNSLVNGGGTILGSALLGEALFSFMIQRRLRTELQRQQRIDTDFWYLQSFGGILLVFVAGLSVFKGITGIGWTWKGRMLQHPSPS